MPLQVGNDYYLYYNTGDDATPVWVEACGVGDVTTELNLNEAEVDLRCTTWVLNLPAKHTGGFSVDLAANRGDTHYDLFRADFFARNVKQYAAADDEIATSGTEYFKAFCFWAAFPRAEPTQEMANHDASLSLAYHEESGVLIEPSWVVVA